MRRKVYNTPVEAHGLTFSTYRRTKVFTDPRFCEIFLEVLERERQKLKFEVWAYVVMPDHAHVLVWPTERDYDVSQILRALKQPAGRGRGSNETCGMGRRDPPTLVCTTGMRHVCPCAHASPSSTGNEGYPGHAPASPDAPAQALLGELSDEGSSNMAMATACHGCRESCGP